MSAQPHGSPARVDGCTISRRASSHSAEHHGDGVRETLRQVAERIPLEVTEVPSGTQVLDGTIPDEWNIRDAYVATADGRRVVDFAHSNLHVVSYSEPVRATMTLRELRPHLHVHDDNPDWVPYRA